MKVAVFSTKAYDRRFLEAANAEHGHELVFFEPHLIVIPLFWQQNSQRCVRLLMTIWMRKH
jgi:hypothetical protein